MIGLLHDHRHPTGCGAADVERPGDRSFQVDLAPIELRTLLADALKMLTADQAEVLDVVAAPDRRRPTRRTRPLMMRKMRREAGPAGTIGDLPANRRRPLP